MKILVTGAGGFLGFHLSKRLIADGHEITNFSRKPHPKLDALGIKTIAGDLSDAKAVEHAFKGMQAVFHVAAKVSLWGRYEDYHRVNVTGTLNVIDACRANGITKLIYTSSPSVVFGTEDLNGVNEDQSYPETYLTPYGKSKAAAEQLVLNANGQTIATVALRPHLIFGPGDMHLFPQVVKRARQGRIRRVGKGKNLVDVIFVTNAVDAHVKAFAALEVGGAVAGRAYFVAQEKAVNLWGFVDQILDRHGLKPVSKSISAKRAYYLGWIIERIYLVLNLKTDPPMTRFIAKQLSHSHYFSHENAKHDFGYTPSISLEEALEITIPSKL